MNEFGLDPDEAERALQIGLDMLQRTRGAVKSTARDGDDHALVAGEALRTIDGWDAANFLQALKSYIENPLRLLST